jgi:hypothetical protein
MLLELTNLGEDAGSPHIREILQQTWISGPKYSALDIFLSHTQKNPFKVGGVQVKRIFPRRLSSYEISEYSHCIILQF